MNTPSSFCTICTRKCTYELVGMLLSLSIHHNNAKVFIICDTYTKNCIEEMTPSLLLDIEFYVKLDQYSNLSRGQMEMMNIWNDFQMMKAYVIEFALKKKEDVMYLDCDIIILQPLNFIDKNYELGLSPHYCQKSDTDKVGYYNGGILWTKHKQIPDDWKKYTKTSRFHDQASLEDLKNIYNTQEFDESVNFGWWRVLLVENKNEIVSNIQIYNQKICYKNKPIYFIHTHLHDKRFTQFNNIFLNFFVKLKQYKELAIFYRILYDKWVIKLPKQPLPHPWGHANDSFRELLYLYKNKNKDIKIVENEKSGHIWFHPNILLYDRPTSLWFNKQVEICSVLYLGNGSMEKEGNILKNRNVNVKPWIFWPRNPKLVEQNRDKLLCYAERNIESIFIGNYENNVQEKHRTNTEWDKVITEFHNTKGNKHKFTQQEYLDLLKKSKYGLCLRGFGSKCHREVELMAFGTIPLITKEVSLSYLDPLIENKHFLYIDSPEQYKTIIDSISEKKWLEMSNECIKWYNKNIDSINGWNTFLTKFFYS